MEGCGVLPQNPREETPHPAGRPRIRGGGRTNSVRPSQQCPQPATKQDHSPIALCISYECRCEENCLETIGPQSYVCATNMQITCPVCQEDGHETVKHCTFSNLTPEDRHPPQTLFCIPKDRTFYLRLTTRRDAKRMGVARCTPPFSTTPIGQGYERTAARVRRTVQSLPRASSDT